jgi:hypothetical protein
MTEPFVFDDLTYISIAEAAVGSRLSTEYLARLARTSRVHSRIIAHMWFIEMHSLQQFLVSRKVQKSSPAPQPTIASATAATSTTD